MAQAQVQTMGGPASDAAHALAQELVSYITGAEVRTLEAMESTGVVINKNQRAQNLVDEVAGKIRAAMGAPPPAGAVVPPPPPNPAAPPPKEHK